MEPVSEVPEPTDEQLIALLADRRREAAAAGLLDDTPFEVRPELPPLPVEEASSTWNPPCVSCHEPLDYTAPHGVYLGRVECHLCRAGSITLRLEASGIGFEEMAEPLAALKPHGPDGKPYGPAFAGYMDYLRKFATLRPQERLAMPFCFVAGTNGVGKSSGAQRALRSAILNGCQGRYLRLGQLLETIYSTYGKEDESTIDQVRFFASVHLLVLDEVGQEQATEHGMGRFFNLMDDRSRNSLPTILISNYLPEMDSLGRHITGKTGDWTKAKGILDRIRGGAKENIFVIQGASWR